MLNAARARAARSVQPVLAAQHLGTAPVPPAAVGRFTVLLQVEGASEVIGAGALPRGALRRGSLLLALPGQRFGLRPAEGSRVLAALVDPRLIFELLVAAFPVVGGSRRLRADLAAGETPVQIIRLSARVADRVARRIRSTLPPAVSGPYTGQVVMAAGLLDDLRPTLEALLRPVLRGDLREGEPLSPRRDVVRVQRLLSERFAESWTGEAIAAEAGLSVSALGRAFRQELGMTVFDYLRRVRLSRFEALVASGNHGVDEAARLVGWSSAANVRRVLKRMRGVSPRQLRFRSIPPD